MNAQLDQIFSSFLDGAGVLAPGKLGADTAAAAPAPAQVDVFVAALASCRDSCRQSARMLFVAYLALAVGVFALLYVTRQGNSSAAWVALLGSTGLAGLIAIPVRMQSLWKDLTIMEMTLAILPSQSPKDQLALIKTLHAASKAGGRV